MAPSRFVHLDRQGATALVRLDRPKVNALSAALLAELAGGLRELATASPPVGALVLWGGERCFSAGADIAELVEGSSARSLIGALREALDLLTNFPQATIAAVTGFALGGGLELALACDLRVVAEGSRLGLPEVRLGVIPGGGGTQRLPRLVGPSRAKELIMSGRDVPADEAARIGLADAVAPSGDVLARALELASQFSEIPPAARAAAKQAIDRGLELPLAEGLALEGSLFEEVRGSEAGQAGLRSFLDRSRTKP